MAGKHVGGSIALGGRSGSLANALLTPQSFNPRNDKAYKEGRAAGAGLQNLNPHVAGTPEFICWDEGWLAADNVARGVETGIPAI